MVKLNGIGRRRQHKWYESLGCVQRLPSNMPRFVGLVSQFENAFVISLSLTLVTTSSAPPGTILQLLLLGFGGLALVSCVHQLL